MNAAFPFDYPLPTAFYLTLYVLTLAIHVVFMNYVLAGSAYLGWVSITGRPNGPVAAMLRDWMPFALSVAITAGVAPLLFIQILYKSDFYTANLLLFHRWMAVVPVLIVGFYLTYVAKSRRLDGRRALRTLVALGALACFAFVAWSWTENHLLSVESQEVKTAFYASGQIAYASKHLLPRLAVWFTGAFPVMAIIVGWQLVGARRRGQMIDERAIAALRAIGIGGAVLAIGAASYYFLRVLPATGVEVFDTPAAEPYVIAAVIGMVLVLVGFVAMGSSMSATGLSLASLGAVAAVVSTTVVRETIRLQAIDLSALYDLHARASQVGGLVVFLIFFALNAVAIVACFVLVRRGRLVEARL